MKVLVFDTETTGLLPSQFPRVTSNLSKFPYIVQLSYIVYDTEKHNCQLTSNCYYSEGNDIEEDHNSYQFRKHNSKPTTNKTFLYIKNPEKFPMKYFSSQVGKKCNNKAFKDTDNELFTYFKLMIYLIICLILIIYIFELYLILLILLITIII